MKYIKTFEGITRKYKIGDYVICDEMEGNNGVTKEFKNFLANNVGQITDNNYEEHCPYVVKYEKIPGVFSERFNEIIKNREDVTSGEYEDRRPMAENEIIYSSKNKKDLKDFILVNKFNI